MIPGVIIDARDTDIAWEDIATRFESLVDQHRELLQKHDSVGGA